MPTSQNRDVGTRFVAQFRGGRSASIAWVGSGVGSTVDGEIGPGDVGRLGTGDEGYQCGNLVCCAVAFERCDGYLGGCPIACGGIEVRVDGARLYVVDRDAAATDVSG